MAAKLSDAQVGEMRRLSAEDGLTAHELAARFGVTRRHVARILAGKVRVQLAGLDRETARGSVAVAVDRLVDGLVLDDHRRVLAETAAVLANRLDAARSSDSATAANAAAGLARELVSVTAELRGGAAREPDALDELIARREARLLALNGVRR